MSEGLNLTMIKKRVSDVAFKKMAMELSDAKGSVKEAAEELGIDSGRISKWRSLYKKDSTGTASFNSLSEE